MKPPRKNSRIYKEFELVNRRRIDLIHKKYQQGLDSEEILELEVCEKKVSEYIETYCPRDYKALDDFAERIQHLKSLLSQRKKKEDA